MQSIFSWNCFFHIGISIPASRRVPNCGRSLRALSFSFFCCNVENVYDCENSLLSLRITLTILNVSNHWTYSYADWTTAELTWDASSMHSSAFNSSKYPHLEITPGTPSVILWWLVQWNYSVGAFWSDSKQVAVLAVAHDCAVFYWEGVASFSFQTKSILSKDNNFIMRSARDDKNATES